MVRVGRAAILANWSARGIRSVEPIVAVGAQAVERAEPERGEVASKSLEGANIKLDSELTDVMAKSGRAMIEALIAPVDESAARS